jgi:hypothetical protein
MLRLRKEEADRRGYTLMYLPIYEYDFHTHIYLAGASDSCELYCKWWRWRTHWVLFMTPPVDIGSGYQPIVQGG